jgi:DNA-directed RNA polymerase beta' subunit
MSTYQSSLPSQSSSRRKLTEAEIEDILQVVNERKGIPRRAAAAYRKKTSERIRRDLLDVEIYPEMYDEFKQCIQRKYQQCQIEPGESVGILCAQSIGEMNTQMTLNSFHHSGISEAAMTEGVPKFQELLSATKNPKIVNCKIYFHKRPATLEQLRRIVGDKLKYVSFGYLISDVKVVDFEEAPPWIGEVFVDRPLMLRFELNKRKMLEYSVYPQDIVNRLHKEVPDVVCYVDYTDYVLFGVSKVTDADLNLTEKIDPSRRYLTHENKYEMYLEEVVANLLINVHVAGVRGIEQIFFEKSPDSSGEWMIQTVGSNYRRILLLNAVNEKRTVSNNVWDIYATLGIEAARNFLLSEFNSVMKGINDAHTHVLVDRMTFNGSISSISRYTLKNECSSVLGKASFEESLENFLLASSQGVEEIATGSSASIICGKKSKAGTGFMDLKIDLDMILESCT